MDNSFDSFMRAVKDSVEEHAQRKGYTNGGTEDPNQLADAAKLLGWHVPHCLCEILYKCVEYGKTPRRVLMEKVAGWAWLVWRDTDK